MVRGRNVGRVWKSINNKTWDLVDLPENRKAIPCKWVFKSKRDVTGEISRYNARLVIKGYHQRKGEDYTQTYAPVVRMSSFRYLLSLAARYDMTIWKLDAVTAFLQGNLENEEIYMEQPSEFKISDKVCRLNKAIYGLKQSSRVWNTELSKALSECFLVQANYDPCVYLNKTDKFVTFVVIYVDDLLIMSTDIDEVEMIKRRLMKKFNMKNLGLVKEFIGIRIEKTSEGISIDQEAYIDQILSRFKMEDANVVLTPLNVSEKLNGDGPKSQKEIDHMSKIPYQEANGCLLYLSKTTRPDISYAVNLLSRYSSNPNTQHWSSVKHLLRYLKGTKSLKLWYLRESSNTEVIGFCDSDLGGDVVDGKSTSGYVFMNQGGAISWASRKQPVVARSTCEAEYLSLSDAVCEAIWFKYLTDELDTDYEITMFCDNKSAITIADEGNISNRTKHIDRRHHFIQDAIKRNLVQVVHVSSNDQIADCLTKSLAKIKNQDCLTKMGLKLPL
jgi:hypothetical protein